MSSEPNVNYGDCFRFLRMIHPGSGQIALFGTVPGSYNITRWLKPTNVDTQPKISSRIGGMYVENADNLYASHFAFDQNLRQQRHALFTKCIVCDIDSGPDKPYKSHDEALTALVEFSFAASMEPTLIVSSGNGVHGYWVMEEAMTAEEWKPLALASHALRYAFGVREDTTVPEDEARVLRIPGTPNCKTDTPLPTSIVYEGSVYTKSQYEDLLHTAMATPVGVEFLESDQYEKFLLRSKTRELVAKADFVEKVSNIYDCPHNLEVVRKILLKIPPILKHAHSLNENGSLAVDMKQPGANYELWRTIIFSALATRLTGIEEVIYEWGLQAEDTYPDCREAIRKVIASDGKTGNAGVGVGSLLMWGKAFARHSGGFLPEEFEFVEPHNTQGFTPGKVVKSADVLSMPSSNGDALRGALSNKKSRQGDDEDVFDGAEAETESSFEPPEDHEADSVFTVMPKGFFRPPDKTGVYLRKVSKDESTGEKTVELQAVVEHDVYVVARSEDDATGNMTFAVRSHPPFREPKTAEFSTGILVDERTFGRALAEKGVVPVERSRVPHLMTYITRQVARLEKLRAAESKVSRFGWDQKCESFVLGTSRFTPEGERKVISTGDTVRKWGYSMEPAGTLDGWKQAVSMFDRPEHQLCQMLIALSMGAPLIHPYGAEHTGGFVYLWSTAGSSGKTTMQRVMQGIWGDPTNPFIMGSVKTSDVTVTNQMGALQDVPFAVDEGTTANTRDELDNQRAKIADLIKQSTVGHGKMRSEQNGTLSRNVAMWYAFTSISMNMSLDNLLGNGFNGPTAQRVVEVHYNVPLFNELGYSVSDTRNFGRAIRTNYGWAGRELADLYVRGKDIVMERMQEESARIADLLEDYVKESRFYVDLFASAHVAAEVACKSGLLSFDLDGLKAFMDDFVLGIVKRTRTRGQFDISDMLSQFITLNRDSTVVVDAKQGSATTLIGDYPRSRAIIRYNRAKNEMDIAVSTLMRYVRNKNIAWEDVLDYVLSRDKHAEVKRRDPLQGLKESTRSQVRMLRFDSKLVGVEAENGEEQE